MPMLIMIGWRGDIDEPQHIKQGAIKDLLKLLDIPVLMAQASQIVLTLKSAIKIINLNHRYSK